MPAPRMPKAIQIRDVPASVHKRLEVLAARAGLSQSELLLREITRFAEMPTGEEMKERLRARKPVTLAETAAAAVRKERDSV